MGKHNRPVDGIAEPDPEHSPVKVKKHHKNHKNRHESGEATPSSASDPKAAKSSSSRKRKRDKQAADCDHDVSPSDDTHHTNPIPSQDKKDDDNNIHASSSPSSPVPPTKKHKKHKDKHSSHSHSPRASSSSSKITVTEMLLEDREKAKKKAAKAAEAVRRQAELEEREAAAVLAEKAARKARKAEKRERKRKEAEAREAKEAANQEGADDEGKERSRSAPETGSNTPASTEAQPKKGKKKDKKKGSKRSNSEGDDGEVIASVDGGSLTVGEDVDSQGKDVPEEEGKPKPKAATTVDDVAERWNIGGLEGGSQRQSKFMRLLGAKKAGITPTVATTTTPEVKSKDRVADELERQFEYGRKMKHEMGGQKRGLGSSSA